MDQMILIFILSFLYSSSYANLWAELERINDLTEFRNLCSEYPVTQTYLEDSLSQISVFAPVDDVFTHNPYLKAMNVKQLLSHIVDVQVPEFMQTGKWDYQTLIRPTVNSENVYITQFENNPGNFSYFANNGKLCNHVSSSWALISGDQYLYKVCTPMGQLGFPGTALSLIRTTEETYFTGRSYDNHQLTQLRDILGRIPDVALVIYGMAAWNGFHTFFLPTNDAFSKVPDRNELSREVLLAHVTGKNRVLFTHSWLYDGGIHYYPSVKFTSNVIEDNFKLKLTMRNITDRKTGRWDVYAVSEMYERYSNFRRGSVWAKVVTPNIPVLYRMVLFILLILCSELSATQSINSLWETVNAPYYVIGGGVKGAIIQENMAGTNGIIHYIDRVLGVPTSDPGGTVLDCGYQWGNMSKCEHERNSTVPMPGGFAPLCDIDGNYEPVQCDGSSGYCWCVNEFGDQIWGTESKPGEPVANCSNHNSSDPTPCEKERDDALPWMVGAFIPQCDHNGNYLAMQCHGSTGECWCVDEFGNEINGTRTDPTKCEMEQQAALDAGMMVGVLMPSCDPDGNYAPLQCHSSSGQCWCVDEEGERHTPSSDFPTSDLPTSDLPSSDFPSSDQTQFRLPHFRLSPLPTSPFPTST